MAEGQAATFGDYLRRALHILGAEAPTHLATVRERLGTRAVEIRVGSEEPFVVQLDGEEPWVRVARSNDAAPELAVAVSRASLAQFLRGELTLEDAVMAERLTLRGALDDVLPFLDAVSAWLHAAVRSPSFPALHREYAATLDE